MNYINLSKDKTFSVDMFNEKINDNELFKNDIENFSIYIKNRLEILELINID